MTDPSSSAWLGHRAAAWRRPYVPLWLAWIVLWSIVAAVELFATDAGLKDQLYNSFAPAAAVAVLFGVWRHRPQRLAPWLFLAAFLGLMGAGDIVYSVMAATGEEPFPSMADAFYLAGLGCLVMAVIGLSGGLKRTGRAAALDASVVTIATGLVFWVFFIEPVVADTSVDLLSTAVAISYPLIDVGLIGLLTVIVLGSRGQMPALRLLLVGVAAFLVSDVVYAFQSILENYEAGLVDMGWLVGYTLFGAAALHPTMTRLVRASAEPAHLTMRRMALLTSAAMVAPVMAVAEQVLRGRVDVLIIVSGSAAIFLLVVARLSGLVRSLRQLFDERVQLQERLEQQALLDPLTDLPNRRDFMRRLAAAHSARPDRMAVMILDVDDFKTVNDTHGHLAGDDLLRGLAARLNASVRPEDTASRIGGDEFAVLLVDCPDAESARRVAERLLEALNEPVIVAGHSVRIRTSIGIAFPGNSPVTAEELIRNADQAMYLAKSQGKHRCWVWQPAMYEALVARPVAEAEIRRGLTEGQFEVMFRPVVSTATGEPTAVEAQVRWNHPVHGEMPAESFRSVIEQSDLLVTYTSWLVDEACHALVALGPGVVDVRVRIPLPAMFLATSNAFEKVREAIAGSALAPARIVFDVPEETGGDRAGSRHVLERLRTLGVRTCLGDFGVGRTSLAELAGAPLDELRLRPSLAAMTIDPARTRLASAVIGSAHALGLWVTADGVETLEELARLRQLGCDASQGGIIGTAVPASRFTFGPRTDGKARSDASPHPAKSARFGPATPPATAPASA